MRMLFSIVTLCLLSSVGCQPTPQGGYELGEYEGERVTQPGQAPGAVVIKHYDTNGNLMGDSTGTVLKEYPNMILTSGHALPQQIQQNVGSTKIFDFAGNELYSVNRQNANWVENPNYKMYNQQSQSNGVLRPEAKGQALANAVGNDMGALLLPQDLNTASWSSGQASLSNGSSVEPGKPMRFAGYASEPVQPNANFQPGLFLRENTIAPADYSANSLFVDGRGQGMVGPVPLKESPVNLTKPGFSGGPAYDEAGNVFALNQGGNSASYSSFTRLDGPNAQSFLQYAQDSQANMQDSLATNAIPKNTIPNLQSSGGGGE